MSNDLSEELIDEIFSRLPTKSLLRFRSVSKSLCARIDSPNFIRLHALQYQKRLRMIIHQVRYKGEADDKHIYTLQSEDQLSNDPFIGEFPFKNSRIVGSCDGIVCVYECQKGYNLWNPSIRRKVTVPEPPSSNDRFGGMLHGFGFDPIINDYKILKIDTTSFVYNMKTCTWHEITSPTTPLTYHTPNACLFNGALHWVVNTWDLHTLTFSSKVHMLTFDLSSEVFSTIELPVPTWDECEVTIIDGCLAVTSSKHYGPSCTWIWKEYNNTASWSLLNTHQLATQPCLVDFSDSSRIITSRIMRMTTCVESLGLLDTWTSCDQGKL